MELGRRPPLRKNRRIYNRKISRKTEENPNSETLIAEEKREGIGVTSDEISPEEVAQGCPGTKYITEGPKKVQRLDRVYTNGVVSVKMFVDMIERQHSNESSTSSSEKEETEKTPICVNKTPQTFSGQPRNAIHKLSRGKYRNTEPKIRATPYDSLSPRKLKQEAATQQSEEIGAVVECDMQQSQ